MSKYISLFNETDGTYDFINLPDVTSSILCTDVNGTIISTTVTNPLNFSTPNLSLNYNTTNLKITATALNTIQDIAISSTPTFSNVILSSATSYGVVCGGTSSSTSLQNAGTGTSGQYLKSAGSAALPTWTTAGALTKSDDTNVTLTLGGSPSTALLNAASLALGWTGQLSETRGGTNQATYTLGDTLYSSASNTLSKLAGNITTTRKFLRQVGNGVASAAPAWDTITAADIPGSALTKSDDTNVTLTLGGSPSNALLNAASLTLGWTGQLSVGRGGTGTGTAFTTGSVVFAGASGVYTQDNAQFFWDDTNNRLGLGTVSPTAKLQVVGVDGTCMNLYSSATFPNTESSYLAFNRGYIGYSKSANAITGGPEVGVYGGGSTNMAFSNQSGEEILLYNTAGFIRMNANATEMISVDGMNKRVGINQATPTQALEFGGTSAQIYLNSATSNMMYYNINGVGAPTFTTRSAGTKIVLYPQLDASNADFALGVEGGTLWYSVARAISTHIHKFYAGTTEIMRIQGDGKVGIGISTPDSLLHVNGITILGGDDSGLGYSDAKVICTDGPTAVATLGQTPILSLLRGQTGSSWAQLATMTLGRWTTTSAPAPQTRLDFNLKNDSTATDVADVTVMTLQSNGYVGIGTTAPTTARFQVVQSAGITASFERPDANADCRVYINSTGAHTTDGSALGSLFFWAGDAGGNVYNTCILDTRADGVPGSGTGRLPASLSFRVGNGLPTAMIIKDNGNVGIGTSTPNCPLEVYKSTAGVQEILRLHNPSTNVSATTDLNLRLGTSGTTTGFISNGWNGSQMYLSIGAGSPASETMRILGSSKFVGINKTAPASPLHVAGATTYVAQFDNTTTGPSVNALIGLQENRGIIGYYAVSPYSGQSTTIVYAGSGKYIDIVSEDRDIIFNTTLTERMRINSVGNVGIGTSGTISAKLHVLSTTEQLRMGYSAAVYSSLTTDINGYTTMLVSGQRFGLFTTPSYNFHVQNDPGAGNYLANFYATGTGFSRKVLRLQGGNNDSCTNMLSFYSANASRESHISISSGVFVCSSEGHRWTNAAASTNFMEMTSAGVLTIGSATPLTISAAGTITQGVWQGTPVALAYGGTNANLTAVNGGVVYSTGSAMAISSAGTAGQVLQSNGAAAPTWTNLSALGVSSITGTANQITASASTGAVTLSLPSTCAMPGSLETAGNFGVGNAAVGYICSCLRGTITTPFTNIFGTYVSSNFFPTASINQAFGLYNACVYKAAATFSISTVYGEYIFNSVASNAGTISNIYGLFVDTGSGGGGTIGNAYGAYILGPNHGTNRVALYTDSLLVAYDTTATSGGTTTLSNQNKTNQYFTGTLSQTVNLPVASTLFLGYTFQIHNRTSAGTLTVNTSAGAGNQVASVVAGQSVTVRCIIASGTTTASWDCLYDGGYTGYAASNVVGTLAVANGGTGVSSWTNTYAILCSGTTSTDQVKPLASGTLGQVLTSGGSGANPTWSTINTLSSGTLTPTAANNLNLTSATAQPMLYSRNGDIVTCTGSIDCTPSASNTWSLTLTIPIARSSNFVNGYDASGVATSFYSTTNTVINGIVTAKTGSQTIYIFMCTTTNTTNAFTVRYSFQYTLV